MAIFGTILNILIHAAVVGASIMLVNYFNLQIPKEYLIGAYFIVQTIRLHYSINCFAVEVLFNNPEVQKKISIESENMGDKNGE